MATQEIFFPTGQIVRLLPRVYRDQAGCKPGERKRKPGRPKLAKKGKETIWQRLARSLASLIFSHSPV